MRYWALACDYDGTLALRGRVDGETVAALERLLATGRRLILVTGRVLHELLEVFPEIGLFEWVVAENGALLYRPSNGAERLLAAAPAPVFAETLRLRGVERLSVGRVIVATWHPHDEVVQATIRDLGLELEVILNKDAVMVLPAGVSKASGLASALAEMELAPHQVVGIGDAENDLALLRYCGFGAAVANALATVKEQADLVTRGDHGTGVRELIELLIAGALPPAGSGHSPHS
jgi:HAD superfamily hydrolase (TIGR01484 family)